MAQTQLKESDIKSSVQMHFLGPRIPNFHLFSNYSNLVLCQNSTILYSTMVAQCPNKVWPRADETVGGGVICNFQPHAYGPMFTKKIQSAIKFLIFVRSPNVTAYIFLLH